MNLSFSTKINTPTNEASLSFLRETLGCEFNKISQSIWFKDSITLEAKSINASFGSILRDDKSIVSIKESINRDGYVVNCDTVYKPSGYFWIFFVFDIFLLTTVVGFLVGMGSTIGLYFYNKTLVEKAIKDALEKAKLNLE